MDHFLADEECIIEPSINNDNDSNNTNSFDENPTAESAADDVIVSTNDKGELQIHTLYMQDYLLHGTDLKPLSIWE
jgi:hypothetical protein